MAKKWSTVGNCDRPISTQANLEGRDTVFFKYRAAPDHDDVCALTIATSTVDIIYALGS